MTILILSIVQTFVLEFSLFKDLHIAFAQSTNATRILVPPNTNKTEITLKNETPANPSSIFENPLLIALISGQTAILGGIMGSHMPNRSNRQMESEILKKFPSSCIMFITAFEFLDHEISKHEIFYDKNIDILIKPVKLRQIEDSLLSLIHNETF